MPSIRSYTPRSDDFLDAAMPLATAFRRLTGRPGGLIPVQTLDGPRVLEDLQIRRAQALGEPTAPLATLVDLAPAAREDTARSWLEANPTRPGCGFLSADGALNILYRDVPQVRCAVVMAGGFGSRLSPLTDTTPKPLLEVGGRILLFRILDLLKRHGVERVFLSIHHLGDQVRDAVQDGAQFGLDVQYLEEDHPLDTGAGLALLTGVDEPFFIMNGDILTALDLTAFGRRHALSGAQVTMGTYRYPSLLRYGAVVPHASGQGIAKIDEKPVYHYEINAGIYAFDPTVLDLVQPRQPLAMVDFLNRMCHEAVTGGVEGFPIVEYWNDVGTHEDFERAQVDVGGM